MCAWASRLSILCGPAQGKGRAKMRVKGVMFIAPIATLDTCGLPEVAVLSLVYEKEMLTHNFETR